MLFRPTLKCSEVRPISANLNRPISDLAHISIIFGQNHSVGHFSHSILSLNTILLSESKNSKNSGIFWNLWNLSVNMTYLAFLPKQDTFPTQIEVPGPILMSKRRNLRDSSNLEFILESLESRFQISEI